MMVREGWLEGDKTGTKLYPWDGTEFANRYERYFVIAASLKTHEEAEAFRRQHKNLENSDVRPSAHYSNLTPGFFIVLVRFETQKTAEDYAACLRKEGTPSYVKRAF